MKSHFSNKCKSCGSELSYNVDSENLTCSHCDTIVNFEKNSIGNFKKAYTEEIEYKPELMRTQQYKCNNCGTRHAVVSENGLKRCPSCGSLDIVKTVDISIKPDGIVPFKINKEQAGYTFQQWIKKRPFAPNNLKKLAKLKKVSASYTPVWSFDYKALTEYSATTSKYYVDNKNNRTTKHFFLNDKVTIMAENFFSSANTMINSDLLRKLGDFGLSKLKSFSPEYTYGWSASVSDIKIQDAYNVFTNEAHQIHVENIKQDLFKSYDSIDNITASTLFENIKYNYVYLPIWSNHYDYKNKNYHCYINGFSGSVVGKSPVSKIKVALLVLGIIVGFALLYYIFR